LIVEGHGQLVGPVAVTIASEDVATLLEGTLLLRAVPKVVEAFN
jgi:hypothetical protein